MATRTLRGALVTADNKPVKSGKIKLKPLNTMPSENGILLVPEEREIKITTQQFEIEVISNVTYKISVYVGTKPNPVIGFEAGIVNGSEPIEFADLYATHTTPFVPEGLPLLDGDDITRLGSGDGVAGQLLGVDDDGELVWVTKASAAETADTVVDNAITASKIASGAVTDAKIGNRTIDPTAVPSGLSGSLTTLLSWLSHMILVITGNANVFDDPLVSLASVKAFIDSKGAANGLAPLGSDSKISTAYLPASVTGAMRYQGGWNASTNSPTIAAASSANLGHFYRVTTAGSTSIDGESDWKVGDVIASNGTVWEKFDHTDQVVSVNGMQGVVTIGTSNISGLDAALAALLPKAGGTMTGKITLDGPPTSDLHAATKAYVDSVAGGGGGGGGGTASYDVTYLDTFDLGSTPTKITLADMPIREVREGDIVVIEGDAMEDTEVRLVGLVTGLELTFWTALEYEHSDGVTVRIIDGSSLNPDWWGAYRSHNWAFEPTKTVAQKNTLAFNRCGLQLTKETFGPKTLYYEGAYCIAPRLFTTGDPTSMMGVFHQRDTRFWGGGWSTSMLFAHSESDFVAGAEGRGIALVKSMRDGVPTTIVPGGPKIHFDVRGMCINCMGVPHSNGIIIEGDQISIVDEVWTAGAQGWVGMFLGGQDVRGGHLKFTNNDGLDGDDLPFTVPLWIYGTMVKIDHLNMEQSPRAVVIRKQTGLEPDGGGTPWTGSEPTIEVSIGSIHMEPDFRATEPELTQQTIYFWIDTPVYLRVGEMGISKVSMDPTHEDVFLYIAPGTTNVSYEIVRVLVNGASSVNLAIDHADAGHQWTVPQLGHQINVRYSDSATAPADPPIEMVLGPGSTYYRIGMNESGAIVEANAQHADDPSWGADALLGRANAGDGAIGLSESGRGVRGRSETGPGLRGESGTGPALETLSDNGPAWNNLGGGRKPHQKTITSGDLTAGVYTVQVTDEDLIVAVAPAIIQVPYSGSSSSDRRRITIRANTVDVSAANPITVKSELPGDVINGVGGSTGKTITQNYGAVVCSCDKTGFDNGRSGWLIEYMASIEPSVIRAESWDFDEVDNGTGATEPGSQKMWKNKTGRSIEFSDPYIWPESGVTIIYYAQNAAGSQGVVSPPFTIEPNGRLLLILTASSSGAPVSLTLKAVPQ